MQFVKPETTGVLQGRLTKYVSATGRSVFFASTGHAVASGGGSTTTRSAVSTPRSVSATKRSISAAISSLMTASRPGEGK